MLFPTHNHTCFLSPSAQGAANTSPFQTQKCVLSPTVEGATNTPHNTQASSSPPLEGAANAFSIYTQIHLLYSLGQEGWDGSPHTRPSANFDCYIPKRRLCMPTHSQTDITYRHFLFHVFRAYSSSDTQTHLSQKKAYRGRPPFVVSHCYRGGCN